MAWRPSFKRRRRSGKNTRETTSSCCLSKVITLTAEVRTRLAAKQAAYSNGDIALSQRDVAKHDP
jgi:hypothetical protein